jgi:hypothetical protein
VSEISLNCVVPPPRYTEDVLAEAHDYASHAGRKTTEVADFKLALASRNLTATAPSRQVNS